LLPLSSSSRDAVLSFRPRFLERRIEKTEAASVELTTEPSSSPSSHPIPSTKMTEHTGNPGCHGNTGRRQNHRLRRYRLCLLPVGAKAAVKHIKTQGNGTDLLRKAEIIKLDFQIPSVPNNIPSKINASRIGIPTLSVMRFKKTHASIMHAAVSKNIVILPYPLLPGSFSLFTVAFYPFR